ncbi:MAG: immunoglobulin domain-containing protein, partial [Candidatus Buchananbacteria bacterium]
MKTYSWLLLGLVAVLLVGCPGPTITAQPVSQTVNPGADVSFSVSAKHADEFIWKKDGLVIPGSIGSILNLPAVTEQDQGSFQATAKNGVGFVDSEVATLTVNDPVAITGQPVSQTADLGDPVTLAVTATGTEPLSYQWYKNGQMLVAATSSSLTIASTRLIDIGSYACQVNNIVNQAATSAEATIQLNGQPAQGIALTTIPEYG